MNGKVNIGIGKSAALFILIFLGYYLSLKEKPLSALGMAVLTYLIPLLVIEFAYKLYPSKVWGVSVILGVTFVGLGFVGYANGNSLWVGLLIMGIFALSGGVLSRGKVSTGNDSKNIRKAP